jgi:hypothetical protein
MSMVGFPLLLIPLAIYNIIVFLMPGVSFTDPVLKLTLTSGAEWPVTLSDMLLALAILMLLFEVIKGARPGAKYLTDHLLSLLVFGGAATEFLLWPRFGGSTFFLLTLLALVDFLTGIALRTRRKTRAALSPAVVAREPAVVAREEDAPDAASPEPRVVPAPEPAEPSAAPIVESVARDRPLPKAPQLEIVHPEVSQPEPVHPKVVQPEVRQTEVSHPEVLHPEVLHPEVPQTDVPQPEILHPDGAPKAPSSEVASPGLQPGGGSPASPEEPSRDPKP